MRSVRFGLWQTLSMALWGMSMLVGLCEIVEDYFCAQLMSAAGSSFTREKKGREVVGLPPSSDLDVNDCTGTVTSIRKGPSLKKVSFSLSAGHRGYRRMLDRKHYHSPDPVNHRKEE
jgi:hypothetical protein